MTIDFGVSMYIDQVLLLGGNHCENSVKHYFYSTKMGGPLKRVVSTDTTDYTIVKVEAWARYYTIKRPYPGQYYH